MKENRAYLVIYFCDLQPTVKMISKEAILPLFSSSPFQTFWARLSDNPFVAWQGQACLEENLGFFLYVATRLSDNKAVVVILLRRTTPSHRDH